MPDIDGDPNSELPWMARGMGPNQEQCMAEWSPPSPR